MAIERAVEIDSLIRVRITPQYLSVLSSMSNISYHLNTCFEGSLSFPQSSSLPAVKVDPLLSETSNSEALRGCDQAEQLALGHAHLIEHTDDHKGIKNKFQLQTIGNFKNNTEENYLSVVHVSKKALKVPA